MYFKCPNPIPKNEPKVPLEDDNLIDPLLLVPSDSAATSMEASEAEESPKKKSTVWKSRRKLPAPIAENATRYL